MAEGFYLFMIFRGDTSKSGKLEGITLRGQYSRECVKNTEKCDFQTFDLTASCYCGRPDRRPTKTQTRSQQAQSTNAVLKHLQRLADAFASLLPPKTKKWDATGPI